MRISERDRKQRDDWRREAQREPRVSRRTSFGLLGTSILLMIAGAIYFSSKLEPRPTPQVISAPMSKPVKEVRETQLQDVILAKDQEVYLAWVTDEVPPRYRLERNFPSRRIVSATHKIESEEWVNASICGDFPDPTGFTIVKFDCLYNVALEDDDELRLNIAFNYNALHQLK